MKKCIVRRFKPTGKWYATVKHPVGGGDIVQWGDTPKEAKERVRLHYRTCLRGLKNG